MAVAAAMAGGLMAGAAAWAQEQPLGGLLQSDVKGQPKPGATGMQDAATPVMERLADFNNLLIIIIVAICIFVLGLILYVVWKFNHKANPTPSRVTHNTVLEVAWTVVPVLILLVIALPSFQVLYYMDKARNPEMTVKATGHQWYWSYQYPDHGGVEFVSNMLSDEEAKAKGGPRLLEVDNRLVVPVDTEVRLLVTGADVLHSWAMPSFGVKKDAVPGRLNETWFKVTQEGVYYGQCSEICGINHGFMPIAVEVVSKEKFKEWMGQQQAAQGITPPVPTQVAQAAGTPVAQ